MDLETAAKKRREKQRGAETVHRSGLVLVRRAEDRRYADQLEAKVKRWKTEPSVEEQVERNRHVSLNGGPSRAQRDEWLRGICDACED